MTMPWGLTTGVFESKSCGGAKPGDKRGGCVRIVINCRKMWCRLDVTEVGKELRESVFYAPPKRWLSRVSIFGLLRIFF